MAIIDTYTKEQERLEKEEKKKAGVPEEPEDTLTVKQIMNNKEQSALWGDMIEHEGDPADKELATRLVSGKLEASDFDRLGELRKDFSEKIREAENIKSEITPELAKEIAKNNPDIQKIIETVGPDGMTKAVHETIKKMAMTDPDNFDKISRQVKTIKSFKGGDLKKLDDEMVEKCKRNNWNADSYMKALAIKDPGERQKALVKVIKEGWNVGGFEGKLNKAINFMSFGSHAKEAANVVVGRDDIDIDNTLSMLESHKNVLGSVLAGSVAGNKDLLEALNREMAGEPKKKEVVGLVDVKKEVPTEESFKKYLPQEFTKWRGKEKGFTDVVWNGYNDAEKDVYRNEFLNGKGKEIVQGRKNVIEGKGGFWSSIFSAIFDTMFAGFDKKSLN